MEKSSKVYNKAMGCLGEALHSLEDLKEGRGAMITG